VVSGFHVQVDLTGREFCPSTTTCPLHT